MIDRPLIICLLGSFGLHYAIAQGLDFLPPLPESKPPARIAVVVVDPPPPPPPPVVVPEPVVEAAPTPSPVKPAPAPVPQPQIVRVMKETAPKEEMVARLKPASDDDDVVYGVDMSSTSTQGTGPGIAVARGGGGGGGGGKPAGGAEQKQGGAPKGTGDAPVPAYEATKLPIPQGRCFGKYTDEARAAGTEGTVTLDLTVDEHGRAHDATVTAGLPNGLSAAALAAARDCVFTPGEKDGKPVAVRIRGFKITFMLEEGR